MSDTPLHEAPEGGPSPRDAEPERIPADPRRQAWVLLVATLIAALGLRAIYELGQAMDRVRDLATVAPQEAAGQALRVTGNFLDGVSVALALVAVYLVVQGVRIVRAGRYPLHGAKVVLDTRVQHGAAARRRAYLGLALAGLLLVGTFLVPTEGRRHVKEWIAPLASAPAPQTVPLDPDAFPQSVPGELLVDPRDPRHPLYRTPEPETETKDP